MGLALQLSSYLLWFPLKVLTISAILRIGVRRYPLIFVYLVTTFLVALVQAPFSISYQIANRSQAEWFQFLHSVGEGVSYSLMLAVVISLIYRATARIGPRRIVRLAVVGGAGVVMATSFLAHYDSKLLLGMWMTPWTRDLDFCAAVLDGALWMLMLASREKDSRLLLLAGGIGIMFAGDAIGAAVRTLAINFRSYGMILFGHVLMMLAETAYLYVWWRVFRKEAANNAPNRGATRLAVSSQ